MKKNNNKGDYKLYPKYEGQSLVPALRSVITIRNRHDDEYIIAEGANTEMFTIPVETWDKLPDFPKKEWDKMADAFSKCRILRLGY